MKKLIKHYKAVTLSLSLIWAFIFIFISGGRVLDISMRPTLHSGDIVVFFNAFKVRQTDIVSFNKKNEKYVKRIIGKSGDKIKINGGNIYLNGNKLGEPYLPEETYTESFTETEYTVPDGCVFVLGDNRSESIDSRYWEDPYVPVEDIEGKLLINLSELKRNLFKNGTSAD